MKKVLKIIILLLILGIIIYAVNGIYEENKIKKREANKNIEITSLSAEENINNDIYATNSENDEYENNSINESKTETNSLDLVPAKYQGRDVIAKLKISKLDINTCVLKEYNKNNLDICVTKFFGADPNEIGNLCIAGHNYITKNMFGYLKWLKIGDKLTITDNKNGEIEYKIYETYRAEANETGRSNTKNKWKKGSYTNYML